MDLYSGYPYWLIRNPLYNHIQELQENIYTDVAVIGSGITGALVAHELCSQGIGCAVFDKRAISTGSTAASTAQLQYEIDEPLYRLLQKLKERDAVAAYKESLQSITDIEEVLRKTKVDATFERKPSLYLASDKKGVKELQLEYAARRKYGIPVSFLSGADIAEQYGVERPAALKNEEAAQMDAYKAATGLFRHHQEHNDLQLYPYTHIVKQEETATGYDLHTENGKIITCKYLVIACGYEAGKFLPKKVMDLVSTYALVTEPLRQEQLWYEECLIWETARPYFYMRTTSDHRIMMGGEDIPFKEEKIRDNLLRIKTRRLLHKFNNLFPHIPVKCEMSWCGTFSTTRDGLPYIGAYPGKKKMLFALGYGGNGITFSMIAAQIISNTLRGRKDERTAIFGFER